MKYVLFYEIDPDVLAAKALGDPFVVNGVVRNWYIREWLVAIATP